MRRIDKRKMHDDDIFFLYLYFVSSLFYRALQREIEDIEFSPHIPIMHECVLSLLAAQERYFLNKTEHAKCLYRKIDRICIR